MDAACMYTSGWYNITQGKHPGSVLQGSIVHCDQVPWETQSNNLYEERDANSIQNFVDDILDNVF